MDLSNLLRSSSEIEIGKKAFKWEDYCKNCICFDKVPGIINFALIEDILQKQLIKYETGRMLLENGIPVEKIEEIRIEFRKIIRIDHLWMFKNLKKLKLDNNFIENIENIESLVHLNELDLSFNKITKIVNLDSLVHLEMLSLFGNMISVIENLDNLKKLTILSIGRNRISDLENVAYLRRLSNLKSLNMAENPCTMTENFRYYIAKFLPNLVYYEYRMITKIEKDIGDEIFHDEFLDMLKKEEQEMGKQFLKEKEEEEAKIHRECFVEFLNTTRLFDSLFETDAEGKAFLLIGDQAEELYTSYEENILRISKNIFDVGREQYRIRQKEENAYKTGIETINQNSQEEAVCFVENFLREKSEIFAVIKGLGNQYQAKQLVSITDIGNKIQESHEIFQKMLNSIWKVLMKSEITLNDRMLEANETYELFLIDLINGFIEDAQELFSHMRNSVTDYHDELQRVAENYISTHYKSVGVVKKKNGEEIPEMKYEDETAKSVKKAASKRWGKNKLRQSVQLKWMMILDMLSQTIPADLKPYVKDKETLTNALATSRDLHYLLVDNREDLLVSRAREWLRNATESLSTNEIKRNREKILEISNFLQKQRDEWDSLLLISESIFRTPLVSPSTKDLYLNM